MSSTDWVAWHGRYADPAEGLSGRLAVVQRHIRQFLDSRAGDPQVLSLCAGDGRDVLGVLAEDPACRRVRARLIELDPGLARVARKSAGAAGLDGVEVVTGDASLTDAYAGAVPADLLLVCGVFGNVSDEDVERTVRSLPQLCAAGGAVVWTRHRQPPDLTPRIRAWLSEAGFAELAFDSGAGGSWAVGLHELRRAALPLTPGKCLFTFVR